MPRRILESEALRIQCNRVIFLLNLWGQIREFPVNFPVSREIGLRERFAEDSLHRQTVYLSVSLNPKRSKYRELCGQFYEARNSQNLLVEHSSSNVCSSRAIFLAREICFDATAYTSIGPDEIAVPPQTTALICPISGIGRRGAIYTYRRDFLRSRSEYGRTVLQPPRLITNQVICRSLVAKIAHLFAHSTTEGGGRWSCRWGRDRRSRSGRRCCIRRSGEYILKYGNDAGPTSSINLQ